MTKGTFGVELIGPFTSSPYKISVNGYLVPHVLAYKHPDNEDLWTLVVDDRLATEWLPLDTIQPMLPFLANCMAVAAGYSCHGENCREMNPYQVKISGISLPRTLHLVKDDGKPE